MKSIKSTFMLFLFLLIGLFSGVQASTTAFESVDISNCQLIKVSTEQMLITDSGLSIVDLETQDLLDVEGFICLENQMYAIQGTSSVIPKGTLCGHGRGCFKCDGCVKTGCWNHCPGCKK